MASRRKIAPDPGRRVRHLIALDAGNVLKRLLGRQEEMVALFSRLRDRGPLLSAARSWFETITFSDLEKLDPAEQRAASAFHELLGELRWYLQYTEDMPLQVQQKVVQFVRRLEEGHRALLQVIGPPSGDGERVVEGTVVSGRARKRR